MISVKNGRKIGNGNAFFRHPLLALLSRVQRAFNIVNEVAVNLRCPFFWYLLRCGIILFAVPFFDYELASSFKLLLDLTAPES